MTAFDESKHPRGQAGNAGQFRDKVNRSPAGGLTEPEPTPVGLDDALAQYGLDADDLPGIEDAWQARFAVLGEDFEHETAAEAAKEVLHISDDVLDVTVLNREADGGLVIEVESQPVDAEDGYREITDTRYVLPAGDVTERLARAVSADATKRHLAMRRTERERYVDGSHPVWHLLADDAAVNGAASDMQRAAASSRSSDHTRAEGKLMEQMLGALNGGEPLDEQTAKRPFYGGAKLSYPKDPARSTHYDAKVTIEAARVAEVAAEHRRAAEKAARLDRTLAEAQALPEGDLKDYLLAYPAPTTLPTTVGTGRNKRTVMKPYQPRPDLIRDHESAQNGLAHQEKNRRELLDELAEFKKRHDARSADLIARERAHVAATAAWWGLGWPGDEGDVPAMPTRTPPDPSFGF